MPVSRSSTMFSLTLVAVACYTCVRCHPVHSSTETVDASLQQTMLGQQSVFKSFDEVAGFLRSWFNVLRTRMRSEESRDIQSRMKRDSETKPDIIVDSKESNDTSFEFYEKQYIRQTLINKTMDLLEQIYTSDQYRNQEQNNTRNDEDTSDSTTQHTDTVTPLDNGRANMLAEEALHELNAMPMTALEKIFRNVQQAAEEGARAPSIADICCQMG